jgi:hypothetical protein
MLMLEAPFDQWLYSCAFAHGQSYSKCKFTVLQNKYKYYPQVIMSSDFVMIIII